MKTITNVNNILFTPTDTTVNYIRYYSASCTSCNENLSVRKDKIKSHKGLCKTCGNKDKNARIKASKLEHGEVIPKKRGKPLSTLIKQWDAQLDNTVKAFNKLFDEVLLDQEDQEVEIKGMFTTDGRVLVIGDNVVHHVFQGVA